MDKVRISHFNLFSRYQTKCVMTSSTLSLFLDQPLKQWLTGMKIPEFEYLKNEKSFLDEIKFFIVVVKGLSFGEKKKKMIKNSTHKL